MYGPFTNEELLGRAIRGKRDGLVIATKFGFRIPELAIDSSPANVRRACDGCLRGSASTTIDLFYQHRVDPRTPIEETVGAVADLVRAGKVRHVGLSECSAATLRRAHAVHPIAAVQSEYSLWERGVEREILPAARELGVGFVPYSPLGRGFLTGQITRRAELADDDYRHHDPRFADENFAAQPRDRRRAERDRPRARASASAGRARVAARAGRRRGADPGLEAPRDARGQRGCRRPRALGRDLARLDAAAPPGATAGARYGEYFMNMLDR